PLPVDKSARGRPKRSPRLDHWRSASDCYGPSATHPSRAELGPCPHLAATWVTRSSYLFQRGKILFGDLTPLRSDFLILPGLGSHVRLCGSRAGSIVCHYKHPLFD